MTEPMENTMFARRNVSIDMLRGLTMLLMVFVNDLWSVGGVPHFLEHFQVYEDGMGVAVLAFLFVILVAVIITHIRIVNTLSSLNYKIVLEFVKDIIKL